MVAATKKTQKRTERRRTMETGISVISTFSRVKVEDGTEYFTGILDGRVLRKIRNAEVEVVLMPLESIPKGVFDLMKKSGNTSTDLLMFGTVREKEKKAKVK